MELRDALAQISEIRLRMARAEVFRGYRALTTAVSGLLALAAAGAQALWIADPAAELATYLLLWCGAAALCGLVVAADLVVRWRRTHEPLKAHKTWLAIEQILPCVAAGALVTFALVRFAPETATLLPGLWQVLFSLGLFASSALLPRGMGLVASFYLVSGVVCLAFGSLSPWAMGLPFGLGQVLAAGVLYWSLER